MVEMLSHCFEFDVNLRWSMKQINLTLQKIRKKSKSGQQLREEMQMPKQNGKGTYESVEFQH